MEESNPRHVSVSSGFKPEALPLGQLSMECVGGIEPTDPGTALRALPSLLYPLSYTQTWFRLYLE